MKRTVTAVAAVAAMLAGCATPSPVPSAATGPRVVAENYPLAWLAGQVGGSRVRLTQLIPANADTHGYELSPAQVADLGGADLVVYVRSLAVAVDQGITAASPRSSIDLATVLPTRAAAADGHADEAAGIDPHLWLDPAALPAAVEAVATRLADLDPEGRTAYTANAAALTDRLESLDAEYRSGLASCARSSVFVTHPAFGYLTDRYRLTQVGLSGVDEDSEPSPARIAEVAALARAEGATTLFVASDASPMAGDTLAQAVSLAPVALTTMTAPAAGQDYLDLSRANLAALKKGLGCS